MSDINPEIDWSLTTWEGSRREQLRRWRKLSLRDRLRAIEEMADTSRRFQAMRAQGRFQEPAGQAGKREAETARQSEVREPDHTHKGKAPLSEITLHGCSPEPLMSYLKALGVLRLVSEDSENGDSGARGFWRNGSFVLKSRLDARAIKEFFLHKYRPSPIVVPWSGSDFFDVRRGNDVMNQKTAPTGSKIVEAFLSCGSERLAGYHEVIKLALSALEALRIQKKPQIEKAPVKAKYIAYLRSHAPASLLPWIDAATILETDKANFNALLGSGGGSDGNTHFSDNFMQNLWDALPDFARQKAYGRGKGSAQNAADELTQSQHWLDGALFGGRVEGLVDKRTSSLFDAGAVGGPNATQGMERKSVANPWNFILALEGSVCFAGTLAKRMSPSARSVSSFPFQVRLSSTNNNGTSNKETAGREIWLPLWTTPTSFVEIEQLLTQGRIELNGKPAVRGVDAARAVASMGIDQGIATFQRYAIVKGRVGGDNYNTASSLGQFEVRAQRQVDLLREIDLWLSRLRRACHIGGKEEAPARFTSALRQIDSAIFDYCRYGGRSYFQSILIALGRAERELMRDGHWAEKNNVRPLHGLSADWIEASRDASSEFELALALSGIRPSGDTGPLRANLEPVHVGLRKDGSSYAGWAEKDRAVVWSQSDLTGNLTAVLARRVHDAARQGNSRLPMWSRYTASLNAIAAYLADQTDDRQLEELLWGLVLIDPAKDKDGTRTAAAKEQDAPPLSRLYALLKPLFSPAPIVYRTHHWRYARGDEGITIHPEPRILSLLRSGRIDEAAHIAAQRLRISGLQPMITRGESAWPGGEGRRLAAALLFPIDSYSLDRLLSLVVREDSTAIQLPGEVA
jgi:CRISPR-associated protein Csx17